MKCPLCEVGIKPDYVFQLNKKETEEKMKEIYDTLSFDRLSRHLLWGHAQADVVKLLMKYIRNENDLCNL